MFKHIGGIQPDPENPGFKNIIIKPEIGGGLSCAKMHYDSANGRIETHWYIQNDPAGLVPNTLHVEVTVPVNTTADIYIPGEDLTLLSEGEGPNEIIASIADGVLDWREETADLYVLEVESGTYHFKSASDRLFPFDCNGTCVDPNCLNCEAEDGTRPCQECNPWCPYPE
jgi:alpha-L-rhamnosidase